MKLGFNHIPKTGGTTINSMLKASWDNFFQINVPIMSIFNEKQLKALISVSDCLQFHSSEVIFHYPNIMPIILSNTYFFSIVRNPIDSFISLWNYQWSNQEFYRGVCCSEELQPKDVYDINEFIRVFYDQFPTLSNPINDSLHFCINEEQRQPLEVVLQDYYISVSSFEELDDMIALFKMLGLIKDNIITKHLRKNPNPDRVELNQSSINLIQEKASKDFEIYETIKKDKIWLNPNLESILTNFHKQDDRSYCVSNVLDKSDDSMSKTELWKSHAFCIQCT